MDDKKIAEEMAQICRDIHRETRGKKRPNVIVGPPELIDLMPSGPGTVINYNTYSLNLRSLDITLVLK